MKPVQSSFCLALVYNLSQAFGGPLPAYKDACITFVRLASALNAWAVTSHLPQIGMWMLDHDRDFLIPLVMKSCPYNPAVLY